MKFWEAIECLKSGKKIKTTGSTMSDDDLLLDLTPKCDCSRVYVEYSPELHKHGLKDGFQYQKPDGSICAICQPKIIQFIQKNEILSTDWVCDLKEKKDGIIDD